CPALASLPTSRSGTLTGPPTTRPNRSRFLAALGAMLRLEGNRQGGPPLGAPQEGGSHMRCKTIAGALVLIAGSAAHAQWSAFNLNPPYYFLVDGSVAQAGAGTQCVGRALVIGWTSNQYHAVLWSVTAPSGYSMIDLNPTGATGSDALGTTGTLQV